MHSLLVLTASLQIIILINGALNHSKGDVRYLHHWFVLDPVTREMPHSIGE